MWEWIPRWISKLEYCSWPHGQRRSVFRRPYLLTRASQHVQILTSAFGRSLLSALGSRRSQGQCSRASFWSARPALLSRTGAEACVVIARALVGLWSVPDDDWALPGLSPDCLRLRAWAGQRYWPVSSAQQHQLSLNYPWSASGLARLQYRWQSVL